MSGTTACVAVALGVAVLVTVAVGEAIALGVGVGSVPVGVAVGLLVAVLVGVAVGVAVVVPVLVGVRVPVLVVVAVALGVLITVTVGVGVLVLVAVLVGVAVLVSVAVAVLVGVLVAVLVGVWVLVAVAVLVGVGVGAGCRSSASASMSPGSWAPRTVIAPVLGLIATRKAVVGEPLRLLFTPSSVVPAGSVVSELMASVLPPTTGMVLRIAPSVGLITYMFWLLRCGNTKSCCGVDTSGRKDRPSPRQESPAKLIAPTNVAAPVGVLIV